MEKKFDVTRFISECNSNANHTYALNYIKGCAVVGAHFGDEGKGKFDDLIIRKYKAKGFKVINVRGQGGGNAGHTVVDAATGKKYDFHYLPSGGLVSDLILLGAGMLLDPVRILKEAEKLPEEQRERILIDGRATFCTLIERKLDGYYESCKEKSGSAKVGSTGSGVGPAVSLRALRVHIQFFKAKACKSAAELKAMFDKLPDIPEYIWDDIAAEYGSVQNYMETLYEAIQKLNIVESMPIIQRTRDLGWAVVLEVSQAFGLDCLFGNEGNFVTSTHTTVVGAMADAGITPADITDGTILVCKAYASKVGGGPFVTGFTYQSDITSDDEDVRKHAITERLVAEYIYENNGEKGVTTGRLRNLGWIDAVAIKAAVQRNGSRILAVNCMDTIGMIPGGKAKICIAYRNKYTGEATTFWPDMQSEFEPIYETIPTGWDIKHADSESNIPMEAWRFLAHVEYYSGAVVKFIGTGGSNTDFVALTAYGRSLIEKFKVADFGRA
ncbi:MAG: adenylosuccinate synthetase [Clostridia bacterium]|nr:adenylosuccinate synthetase [Clostridia bacterium]